MNDTVIRQVEQFVYREARLLDERRFASGSTTTISRAKAGLLYTTRTWIAWSAASRG
jgi:3-phenylpropionate/cinnamic acid dioxygenase small subunit